CIRDFHVTGVQTCALPICDGVPITIRDVAEIGYGKQLRTGASTRDGRESVLGTAVMLIGENSRTVSKAVAAKLREVAASLPRGRSEERRVGKNGRAWEAR